MNHLSFLCINYIYLIIKLLIFFILFSNINNVTRCLEVCSCLLLSLLISPANRWSSPPRMESWVHRFGRTQTPRLPSPSELGKLGGKDNSSGSQIAACHRPRKPPNTLWGPQTISCQPTRTLSAPLPLLSSSFCTKRKWRFSNNQWSSPSRLTKLIKILSNKKKWWNIWTRRYELNLLGLKIWPTTSLPSGKDER